MGSIAHRGCPVCGGAFTFVVIRPGRRIARCRDCGHVFVQNPPSWDALFAQYQGMAYFEANYGPQGIHSLEDDTQWAGWLRQRLGRLRQCVFDEMPGGRPLRIVEVGCLEGRLVAELAALGHAACGCDPNAEVATRGREAFGVDIRAGTAATCFTGQGGYDLLLAFHVLHFAACPQETLASWVRLLRPGGRALVEVPLGRDDYDYRLCLQYFGRNSLETLAKTFFSDHDLRLDSYVAGNDKSAQLGVLIGVR